MDIYRKETERRYGYVVVDNTPETSSEDQIVGNTKTGEDVQQQNHVTIEEPIISENVVQDNIPILSENIVLQKQPNDVKKVETNYLKKHIRYKKNVDQSISETPDVNVTNMKWNMSRLDRDNLEVIKRDPVNEIPSYHVGYEFVAVYKVYAHKIFKYHSQFYSSEYDTSYWPCLVGHSGVDWFNMYICFDYPPLKHFLKKHVRDLKYWR